MNTLDLYDLGAATLSDDKPDQNAASASGSSSTEQTASTSASPQPSLNEEVNQVIGQLGRFWGGFRKQVS